MTKISKLLGLTSIVIIWASMVIIEGSPAIGAPPSPQATPTPVVADYPKYACSVTLDPTHFGDSAPTNPSSGVFHINPTFANNGTYSLTMSIYETADVLCQFQTQSAPSPANSFAFYGAGSTAWVNFSGGVVQIEGNSSPDCSTGPGPFTSAYGVLSNSGKTLNITDSSHTIWNGTTAQCTAQN
jgi:hypothetical protein